MLNAVRVALENGRSEDEAVALIRPDLRWHRKILPSPHHGIQIATAESSLRSAYRIARREMLAP
jgi:hypothetical protein